MRTVTNNVAVYQDVNGLKRPTILFLHGIGEKGDGTTAGLSNLENFINSPNNNIRLNLGKVFNGEQFNIIAPQLLWADGEWRNDSIDKAYNYALTLPEVDPERISLVGISLGGGGVLKYLSVPGNGQKFNVAVSICPAYAPYDAKIIAQSGIATWFFHANDDGVCPVATTNSAVSNINANNPAIPAYKTIYLTGNHYIWGTVFGTEALWLWMQKNTKTKRTAPGSTQTTPLPAPSTVKSIPEVKNLTSTTATLDGSKSEGKITWSNWEMILPNPANHPNVFPNWQKGGPVLKIENLKPNTDYQFKYTVNGTVSEILSFKTLSGVVSPVFVEASIPAGKTKVIVREDKTVEFL